jgi:hypothetical protein
MCFRATADSAIDRSRGSKTVAFGAICNRCAVAVCPGATFTCYEKVYILELFDWPLSLVDRSQRPFSKDIVGLTYNETALLRG